MIFTNPWGFLALLSIPIILGLHFFRSHRKTRVVGGLHLWKFAATRQPVGNRFTRFLTSFSLLFQLLAATLLSLLIAGVERPRGESETHYTIILDDSVSMSAVGEASPTTRAREALEKWADPKSRYTVVIAGVRPSVLAGPYADRDEMLRRLGDWQPNAPSCDLAQGVQLASRFLAGDEKMLFITDQPDLARDYVNLVEILGVGEVLSNNAIVFADRARVSPDRDRVFVTLQRFAKEPHSCRIQARAGGQLIYEANPSRELTPDKPDAFSFDFNLLDSPVEISIETDALVSDNRVVLSPVPIRHIRVHAEALEPLSRYLARAVEATPFAFMEPSPEYADIVFCGLDPFPPPRLASDSPTTITLNEDSPPATSDPFPKALLDKYSASAIVCAFPDPRTAKAAGVAQGLSILADSESLITQGLPLEEGVLWPYVASSNPSVYTPLLATMDAPLLYGGPVDPNRSTHREFYHVNLLIDRTNIYQMNVWPVLVRNFVEQARRVLPGMSRSNYRLGEQIHVSLDPVELGDDALIRLTREGRELQRFTGAENLPRILEHMETGTYQFLGREDKALATFSINLFAPAESDLTGAKTLKANLSELEPGLVSREKRDNRLFLILTLLMILFTALSWIFQDSSR